ncbi:efflux RND transporter periplasmic adaptor subunit [Leptospira sp. 'Mane']|uniref:efflux RND transporter periplasmic adaptor subunit n=1 Tax=Leptospira sp. 'Mane' TaxID=3387407 RepID=UPI00398B9708
MNTNTSKFYKLTLGVFFLLIPVFISECKETEHKHQEGTLYTCPMHTEIRMKEPGNCPICHMTLVPVDSSSIQGTKQLIGDMENEISVSSQKQNLIGIKTEKVKRGSIEKQIRSSGRIAYDPDLFQTFSEYREVLNNPLISSPDIIRNLRSRFLKMGLTEGQIKTYAKKDPNLFLSGRIGKQVLVFSQIYEKEIPLVKAGEKITVFADSFPEHMFGGNIESIDNLLDDKNRTLRVWSLVKDPNYLLKPEMFVEVRISQSKKDVLLIPEDSVSPTGTHEIVYIKTSEDRFSPRIVKTGFSSDGWVEVVEGLEEGETVASGANFLLDSEAKLKLGSIRSKGESHD